MDKKSLKTITKSPTFSLYEIPSEKENFKTFIISTPETREITTNPFLVGKDYRDALKNSIKKALLNPKINSIFKEEKQESLNVLHFLRGGLNFGIIDALGEIGFGNARGSYMSSERTLENGEWKIKDDNYIKINFSENPTVFIGDIVATGSTLKAALEKIKENKIKNMILFTLGGKKAEEVISELNYENSIIVYIEGRFYCPDSESPVRIKIPGTDLYPFNSHLAPEFEEALFKDPIKAIERCIVYDGGSRGLHPSHHFEDVLEYTNQMKDWLAKDTTLYELILDRWQNASNLPEEIKNKLQSSEFANAWLSERTEKINTLLVS